MPSTKGRWSRKRFHFMTSSCDKTICWLVNYVIHTDTFPQIPSVFGLPTLYMPVNMLICTRTGPDSDTLWHVYNDWSDRTMVNFVHLFRKKSPYGSWSISRSWRMIHLLTSQGVSFGGSLAPLITYPGGLPPAWKSIRPKTSRDVPESSRN